MKSKTLFNTIAVCAFCFLGLLLKALGGKFGLAIDSGDLQMFYTAVAGVAGLYIAKQWHVDVKTNGQTTQANQEVIALQAQLADQAAEKAAQMSLRMRPPPVPPLP
jgi:hypothetical protein